MARYKRHSPQGRLRLKYPKNYDNNKSYTLYYEYTWLGTPIRKDSSLKVRVTDWNPKGNGGKGELKTSFGATFQRENNRLNDTLQKYDDKIRTYVDKHPNQLSAEIIHDILFDKPLTRKDEARDFVEYVIGVLKSRLTSNKIGKSRYENGVSNMKGFTEFLKVEGKGTYKEGAIYLGDISRTLVEEYINFRRGVRENSDETINHALTPIIIACERAKEEGFIDGKVYLQIRDCRLNPKPSSLNTERYDGKYLSKEELGKLVEFYNTDTEVRRKEYIEMFLFAFHAGGLRMVDMMTLMWEHINFDEKKLKKTLIKTQKGKLPRHTVPLNDAAIAILRKWQVMARRQRFVFDLVDDGFNIDDEAKLYYVRNSCDRKVNQSLQVVGDKLGLKFNLSFHVARHSFAINALNDGMSLSVVSRLLGHASTDTTETVYAEYLPHTLAEELDNLHYNFLPDLGNAELKNEQSEE